MSTITVGRIETVSTMNWPGSISDRNFKFLPLISKQFDTEEAFPRNGGSELKADC
jgi:hypothetical protein